MISLDLSRAVPVDTTKLHLMKGRKVSVCWHCHTSVGRASLLRCNECRHDFCANCLDACRCYTQGGFRIGWRKQKSAPTRHLALVASSASGK